MSLLMLRERSLIRQVGGSGRNDPGSNSILGSTFAAKVSSNFIIKVRNTTDHEPSPFNRRSFFISPLGQ